MKVVDIDKNKPHNILEIICIKCYKRWIAVIPEDTLLKDLECSNCGQGFCIDTGEILNDD